MRIFLLLLFILVFFSSAFSQVTETKKEEIEISICRPSITQSGRQSHFQFQYLYLAKTDEKGLVKEIKEVSNSKDFRHLMNDEDVIPCIKKWKLKPYERYFISITEGTTDIEKSLIISSKSNKIKILL